MAGQHQSHDAGLAVAVLGVIEAVLGSDGPIVREDLPASHRQCSGSVEDDASFRFLDAYLDLAAFDQLLAVGICDDIRGLRRDIDGDGLLAVEDAVGGFVGAPDRQMHLVIARLIECRIYDRSYADSRIVPFGIPIIPVIVLARYGIV